VTNHDQGLRLAESLELFTGVLLDTPAVCVSLLPASERPPARPGLEVYKVTPRPRGGTTYFNLRVSGRARLRGLLEGLVTVPDGGTLGVHRLVVALAGVMVPDTYEVHHVDHNHLDNRFENLRPVTKTWHATHHDQHGRLKDPPGHLDRLNNLELAVLFKAPEATPTGPGNGAALTPSTTQARRDAGLRAPGDNAAGVNPDGTERTVDELLERTFQDKGQVDEPGHQRRILQSRELRRFGFKHRPSLRAHAVLMVLMGLRRKGKEATVAALVAAVTAKSWSPRTAYSTLEALIRAGLVVKQQSGMYSLAAKAFKTVPARKG
jgi:hypothetical protein